jgi:hypothetical protein
MLGSVSSLGLARFGFRRGGLFLRRGAERRSWLATLRAIVNRVTSSVCLKTDGQTRTGLCQYSE